MLTAVWVAVVAFVIGVGVAVYVMLKAGRLMAQTSTAIASLREREDLLIDRAGAAIDRAGEQIARTETITVSMDDVTASMAELQGRIRALAPVPRPSTAGTAGTGGLTWAAALVYGVARALGLRWAARYQFIRRREPGPQPTGERTAAADRRPALNGRRSGASR
jgi:hypothetical protein